MPPFTGCRRGPTKLHLNGGTVIEVTRIETDYDSEGRVIEAHEVPVMADAIGKLLTRVIEI